MEENRLLAISPIDGRYGSKVEHLSKYLSEWGLIRYRIKVETEWLIEMCRLMKQDIDEVDLRTKISWIINDLACGIAVKKLEKVTNHDVKAVEYYMRDLDFIPDIAKRWIHYGLTSQDINTSANMMQTRDAWDEVLIGELNSICHALDDIGSKYHDIVMISRTHGQVASPTTLGKEFMVFKERLDCAIKIESELPWSTKFGGAVGNFNSLVLAHPEINWKEVAGRVTKRFGLDLENYTTQIDHYDNLCAHFDSWARINRILVDLCRDIWAYISMDYFKLKIVENEVGSSAMPHKVNPIDFENAEGNLLMANSVFEFLSRKLPISRLQRDLTDSTVLRNIGVALGHTLVGFKSIIKGLVKLEINQQTISRDLNANWIVVAEGIQIVLRSKGIDDAYERIKELTRGVRDDQARRKVHLWISELDDIDVETKEKLLKLVPEGYIGNCV